MMIAFLALASLARCGDDDFWDQLADDDVVVEDKVEGRLYDKARFRLPIRRRLRLYPEVLKTTQRLDSRSRLEFIYEAKVPSLQFLDSDDVIVETIDIAKMSQDEIIAVLDLRGFADATAPEAAPEREESAGEAL